MPKQFKNANISDVLSDGTSTTTTTATWYDNITTTDMADTMADAIIMYPHRLERMREVAERIDHNEIPKMTVAEKEKALGIIKSIKKSVQVIDRDIEKKEEKYSVKAKELAGLGFTKMAQRLQVEADRFMKEVLIASYGYLRIPYEKVKEYEKKLQGEGRHATWGQKIEIVPLADYAGIPPAEVLKNLKKAQGKQVFDDFAILYIQKVPDPILIGRIEESKDFYFITEWGEDIKMEDIMEG